MGASRKLQGEIDRVLKKVQEGVDVFDSIWNKVYDTDNANLKEKFEADLKKEIKKLQRYRDQIKTWIQSSEIKDKKVSASYEQALMDARKQIEREMERFKICEKETKTKAFSKEGLGQQPKTDPKEKAKSETRDWLNNVVNELENQIESFEAEIEGFSAKKGKSKPPRLMHLEASISRHKAHIMKLELILRLLDNDELSPDQVNDVKDFLDGYVERNQEDFDEFSDVDELYQSLPLDMVESLEDLVTIGPPGIAKGASASGVVLGTKTSLVATTQTPVILVPDQVDDVGFQEDVSAKTPSTRNSSSNTSSIHTVQVPGHSISSSPSALSPAVLSSLPKEEEAANFSGRKSSSQSETGLRTIGRVGLPSQTSPMIPPISGNMVSNSGGSSAVTSSSDTGRRNLLGSDDRSFGAATTQSVMSPLTSRVVLPQVAKADGLVSVDSGSVSDTSAIGSRVLSSGVPPMQWRPGSSFQDQNEVFRGRTEILPDQREKFLQRFQQVQQQGQANLLGMPSVGKQYPVQPQSVFLQQFNNTQSATTQPQLGLGIGIQAPGLSTGTASASISLQQSTILNSSNQNLALSSSSKDAEIDVTKVEDLQQLQSVVEDSAADSSGSKTGVEKVAVQEDESKASLALDNPSAVTTAPLAEHPQIIRPADLSPGLPLQSVSTSGNHGIIGRRSASDLGTIGDNFGVSTNSSATHDMHYNLQMLEAAYNKLPQPKDSERLNTYVPKRPAATPSHYPQSQAPIIYNPTLWERLGAESCTDSLFFAFYYQQNTYQQYLAAKELKKQSWRYHRKFNTWFQRHEEPKVTTDDFEQGAYVYFDFHISNDEQHGWCQRIKTNFTFEYIHLEDDLIA